VHGKTQIITGIKSAIGKVGGKLLNLILTRCSRWPQI